MKKLIALLLCLCMVFSLVACGDNSDKNTEDPTEQQEETIDQTDSNTDVTDDSDEDYDDDEDEDETEPEEVVIRENGKLPEDIRELSDEELLFYVGKMMKAAIELDLEAIKEYDYYENTYDYFENIAKDERYAEMYKNTIGTMVYIDSSAHIVYKDPYYMYARWYTDMWEKQAELPESVDKLSLDEVDDIYNKYYADAPYIIDSPDFYDNIRIIDGYIKMEYDEIFEDLDFMHINDMQPGYGSYDTPGYIYMLFGDHGDRVGAYEEIEEEGKLTDFWKSMYEYDLDAMIAEVESLKYHTCHDEDSIFGDVYKAYYKDDALKAKIKAWMDENVKTYRDEWYLVSYMPLDLEWHFGRMDSLLTDEERAVVESLNPQYCSWTIEWDEDGGNAWGLYFDVVETMVLLEEIEDLY